MPELPEVESVRRSLARARLDAPIVEVWRSAKPLRTGVVWRDERLHTLVGTRLVAITRRGKFLVAHASAASKHLGLVVHLGMSGRLLVADRDDALFAHTHVRVHFADGRELRFVDPRRFGGMIARDLAMLPHAPPLCELGPEPLSPGFDGATLHARAGRSERALHDVLLDQRVVAGVGNIYAQEAMFVAGLHPLRRASSLRTPAWQQLAEAIQHVLRKGVQNGGTTLRDYRDANGREGRNQRTLCVYGRAGESCMRCGATLRGYERGGRRGVFCPREQSAPRRARVD